MRLKRPCAPFGINVRLKWSYGSFSLVACCPMKRVSLGGPRARTPTYPTKSDDTLSSIFPFPETDEKQEYGLYRGHMNPIGVILRPACHPQNGFILHTQRNLASSLVALAEEASVRAHYTYMPKQLDRSGELIKAIRKSLSERIPTNPRSQEKSQYEG